MVYRRRYSAGAKEMIKEFYNKDCMEVMKDMPDKCVDMILTDIPYELHPQTIFKNTDYYKTDEFGNKYKGGRGGKLVKWGEQSVNKLSFDLTDFLSECLRLCKGTICIFCEQKQLGTIWDYLNCYRDKNKGMLRQLIYQKTNPIILNADKLYLNDIENIVLYKFPNGTFNNKYTSSVLTYPLENGATRIHPTEKNHALLKQLIEDNTNKGDIVFDPCMGSGSTCLVALQTGRQTIGCEIDKCYFDKAVERIKDKGNYQFNLLEDYQDE